MAKVLKAKKVVKDVVPTKVDSPFLDVYEAAKYLKVKPSTIYAWVHQKHRKFPVRYHGRKVVFTSDDLKEWSNRQMRMK